jgi:hypothetical protein
MAHNVIYMQHTGVTPRQRGPRRRRRINDAKPLLIAALDTFQLLRARSWAQRAETELRACGVRDVITRAGARRTADPGPAGD